MHKTNETNWWGRFKFKVGKRQRWRVGSLSLSIERSLREWIIAYEHDDIIDDTTMTWEVDPEAPAPSPDAVVERFLFQKTTETITLLPLLADRPIVTRPITPFVVGAGEEAIIYISSPLWIGIETGDPPRIIREIPLRRLSDTWFGPSTQEGELCYANRTLGRLELDEEFFRPHRAITTIRVQNRSTNTLPVDRLKIPVPYLSLFAGSGGQIWTQVTTMIHQREEQHATLHIENSPPLEADKVQLITGARETLKKGLLFRAFSNFKMKS